MWTKMVGLSAIVPHIEGQRAAFSVNQRSGYPIVWIESTAIMVPARGDLVALVHHYEADSRYCTRYPNNTIAPGT